MIKLVILTLGVIIASLMLTLKQNPKWEDEVVQLASIINAECSNCREYEMYLVGSCVVNRLKDPLWPKSLDAVIRQDNQFHGYQTKYYRASPQTLYIAKNLLDGIGVVPEITFFCTKSSDQPMSIVLIKGQYHLYGK